MKVHYFQHVPFESLGAMEQILAQEGHSITCTRFFEPYDLPSMTDIDLLIIMGGPMGVNDDAIYPWLSDEKKLIADAVEQGKKVLGICLGAQLIAQVMGAKVYPNAHREIGWFDIEATDEISGTVLSGLFPRKSCVFHWHGDTFEIPEKAVHIAQSQACTNQGFIYDDRVIGFQFHLESTQQSVENLVANCRDELDGSSFVQSEEIILSQKNHYTEINQLMRKVLAALL